MITYIKTKWAEWQELYKEIKNFRQFKSDEYDKLIKRSQALRQSEQVQEKENEMIRLRKRKLEAEEESLQDRAKNIHILIRHNLAGDPLKTKVPDTVEEDEGFYGEANTLSKNKTLLTTINQLKKEFLENIAYEVQNLEWLNANRMRIDGLTILVERLEQMGAEKEQYDRGRKKDDGGSPSESGGDDQGTGGKG
jgi:hypothetical protein